MGKKEKGIFEELLEFLIIVLILKLSLSLVFGTTMPLVVVMSHSMTHDSVAENNFAPWLLQHNFTAEEIGKLPFLDGLNKGDIAVVCGRCKIEKGDVIVYRAPTGIPIIHRVVEIKPNGIVITKGDRNPLPDPWEVENSWVYGKVIFRIPYLGWPRVLLGEVIMKIFGVVV